MNIKPPAAYDVSHYVEIPDFTQINPKPVWMATKATEGNYMIDDKFLRFFTGMKQIGCTRAAYHFHRRANSSMSQANLFIATVQDVLTPDDTIVLDVEEDGTGAAQIRAWIDIVQTRFPNNLIIIYSRANILNPILMTQSDKDYFKQIPIWTAGYPSNPDLYTTVPAVYVPDQSRFGPVYIWQYSDDGNVSGILGKTDLNWISPAYLALIGDLIPPPNGGSMWYKATGNLTMRTGPGSGYAPATLDNIAQYVLVGDYVEGTNLTNGFVKILSIFRGGLLMSELNLPTVRWCGTSYLTPSDSPLPDTTPPPAPSLKHTILVYDNGSLIIDGNPYP